MGSFCFQAALGYEGYTKEDEGAFSWYENLQSTRGHWKKRAQKIRIKARATFITNSREWDEDGGHFKEQDTDQVLD